MKNTLTLPFPTPVVCDPLHPLQRLSGNPLSMVRVGLLKGQVDSLSPGPDGFGDATMEGLEWVDLDDYHRVCNFSTHRAGDWMIVDRERADAPPKVGRVWE